SDSQVRNARFHGFAHHLLLRPLPVLVGQAVKPKLLPVLVNHAPQLVQLPIQLIVHGHLTKLLNLRRQRLSHARDLRAKRRLRPVGGRRSAGARRPASLCQRLLVRRLKRPNRRRVALKQLLQLEHRLHLLKSLLQLALSLSKPLRLAGVVRLTQVALAPLLKLRQTELLPANLNQRVFAALVLGRLAVLRVGGSLLFLFAFWLILSLVLRVIQAQHGPHVPLQPFVLQRRVMPQLVLHYIHLLNVVHLPFSSLRLLAPGHRQCDSVAWVIAVCLGIRKYRVPPAEPASPKRYSIGGGTPITGGTAPADIGGAPMGGPAAPTAPPATRSRQLPRGPPIPMSPSGDTSGSNEAHIAARSTKISLFWHCPSLFQRQSVMPHAINVPAIPSSPPYIPGMPGGAPGIGAPPACCIIIIICIAC